jgi:uncharacterized PurR-regulated membrane protein YhhQ (DUF165 family)
MAVYLVWPFLDIGVFQYWKSPSQTQHLWLRATGSTSFRQVVEPITMRSQCDRDAIDLDGHESRKS